MRFQKYGILDGAVKQVSTDAQESPEPGSPAIKSVRTGGTGSDQRNALIRGGKKVK